SKRAPLVENGRKKLRIEVHLPSDQRVVENDSCRPITDCSSDAADGATSDFHLANEAISREIDVGQLLAVPPSDQRGRDCGVPEEEENHRRPGSTLRLARRRNPLDQHFSN